MTDSVESVWTKQEVNFSDLKSLLADLTGVGGAHIIVFVGEPNGGELWSGASRSSGVGSSS